MNIENLVNKDFRGVMRVRKNEEVLFEKSYGFSDLANEIPNALDTKFATASAGKVFVAVAIMQLIEMEMLKFQDNIGGLLNIDLKEIDPKITVKELLTHTSGIPDYFDESVMQDYEQLWTDYPNYKIRSNSDLVPLFIDKPMLYERGTKFSYNNTGFVVLAMIIEKLTNMPFDKYLKMKVFDICKMENTGYYELDKLPAKCANNYIMSENINEYRTNIYSVDVKGTGAGGAFTTIEDISKFWKSLLSYKLLSKEMTNNMISCHSGDEEDGYYGYGIWLKKKMNNSFIPYFQGFDPGVSFVSLCDRDTNIEITAVSNYGDRVWNMVREILEKIMKEEVSI